MWPFRKKAPFPIQVGQFQLTAELPNKRGIGCHVTVLQGETLADVNRKLDVAQEAIERQRYRCEVPELEARLDQLMQGMGNARDVLTELENRQKTGEHLTSQERQNINNLRVSLEKVKDQIEKGQQAIVEAKRKAGVG